MQTAFRSSAQRIRTLLQRGQVTPAAFAAALAEVPPRARDEWLDVLWDAGELPDDDPNLPRGCVPYLPCDVATVLEALRQVGLTEHDVFVDVGAGAGRATLLAHLLTGAGSIGLEIQPALARTAQARADWLELSRARFLPGDAAELLRFVTTGSVYFLYCPFGGVHLQRLLASLGAIVRTRQIRICCVDMPPLERPWLSRLPGSSPRIDLYQSPPARDLAV